MVARSKAWVSGSLIAGMAGSKPTGGMNICLLCLLCAVKIETPATGRSLVQGSPTVCKCVSLRDRV